MFTSLTWAGSLPNGTSGQRYSQTVGSLALEIGENSSTYAWAFVGAAPFSGAGLSATLFGVGGGSVVCTLTGTPSSTGTKTFTVKVRHIASGSEQTQQFSVYIAAAAPPPDPPAEGDGTETVSWSLPNDLSATVGESGYWRLGAYYPNQYPQPTLIITGAPFTLSPVYEKMASGAWDLSVRGTPNAVKAKTSFTVSVKGVNGTVISSSARTMTVTASATPPVTVSVTQYTAPAMTVGLQYVYTVGVVVQPSATAAQAVWTLDNTHADYARLPAGTSMTTAGKLTIRPANTTPILVPVRVTVPHPTAGQAALIYTGLFPITDITAATPTPSVKATMNSFPQATVGVAYSRTVGTITAPSSGGTWSLADRGTLPSGATLSSAGVLATTFTAAGTFTAQVKASATGYLQALYPISITAVAASGVGEIVYSLNALANATVGVVYSATLGTVSTPASGATWSFASRGNLPSGAALSSAGVLTATFPTVQSYIFTAKISASGYTDKNVGITVQCVGLPAIVLQRAAARALVAGELESVLLLTVTVPAPGSVLPFVLTRGTLPASLTILQQGHQLYLQGTPEAAGTFAFSITSSATGYAPRKDAFQVSVIAASQIQVTWAALPSAQPAVAYSQSLGTVTAPGSGAEWALSGRGNLPAAATVSSAGVLSATLPTAQLYRFTVSITAPDYPLLAQTLELPCGENTKSVKVNQPTYANASVGAAYAASLGTVTDPPSGATWALTTRGTLPSGATVSSAGQLAATFTAVGSYQGTVTVSASGYVSTTLTVKITVVASSGTGAITVAMSPLPHATTGVSYCRELGIVSVPAQGSSWALSASGTLPTNTTVSPAGIFNSTFSTAGTFSGTVTIRADGYTPITRTITIIADLNTGIPTVEISHPSSWAHASVDVPYATILGLVVVPNTGVTWTLTNRGTLPANATLTGSQFSATFSSTGTFTGEATLSAPFYQSLVLPLQFTVDAASGLDMEIEMSALPSATKNMGYSAALGRVTAPTSGAVWSLADRGTLPSGAAISSTGTLTATFSAEGTFTGTARIIASGYKSRTATVTVVVIETSNDPITYFFMDEFYQECSENPDLHSLLGGGEVWLGMVTYPALGSRFTITHIEGDYLYLQLRYSTTYFVHEHPVTGDTLSLFAGTFVKFYMTFYSGSTPGIWRITYRIDTPGYAPVEKIFTIRTYAFGTGDTVPWPPLQLVPFTNPRPMVLNQFTSIPIGVVMGARGFAYPTWSPHDLPDGASLYGNFPVTLAMPPLNLGVFKGSFKIETEFQAIACEFSVEVVANGDPPVQNPAGMQGVYNVIAPIIEGGGGDPGGGDPGGGGSPGGNTPGGGWGGGPGCKPRKPKPPVVVDDLGATWVVRHTAQDDGQGVMAPTLNSLGTVDYGAGHLYFPPTFNYVVKRWSVPNAGGTGEWVYQEIPDTFGNGSEVTVSYVPDSVEPEEVTAYLPPPQLEVDLTPFNADAVIPGSVKFTIGSAVFQDYEGVVVMNPDANGIGTEAGTISYQTGKVVLHTWQAGDQTFALQALATVSGRYTDTAMRFRVASAPLRPSGFTVAATALDGELLSGTADLLGIVSGNGIAGTIDTEYGLCNLLFGEYVLDSTLTDEQKAEEWYDAGEVLPNGTIWQPRKVFPSSVRYNAVAYTSIPVSADIIGLDPVRLPSDGRVPIFVKGQLALVHQTSSLVENTLSPTQVLDTGEERLYRVALTDALGQLIGADQYVLDRAAGTVTMNANWSSAPYTAPFTLRYTIADLRIISAVDLSGKITFNRALSHAYAQDDARLSGVLYIGTLQARVTNVFTQAAWTSVWQDTVIGTPPLARYNDIQYPVQVNNRNAYPDRFLIKFTSATEFQVIGENLGVIGTGSIAQDCSPVNTLTGYAYFTIPYQGWGVGWATGNCVRFNVVGACYPVDCARAIQPSEPSSLPDGATLLLIGNVDNA